MQALSPIEAQLLAPLTALVRRELVRPDRAQFPGEDAYRFRHLLIRDAAYDALPKATRAELHERFAAWIGERGSDLVELDEVVGYHLERAYRYRVELGPAGEAALKLAERAAERLGAAGEKASARGDMRAATGLFVRAADLYPPDDVRRLAILTGLGRALHEAGQWDRAEAALSEAVRIGLAAGERRLTADASVALTHLRLMSDTTATHDRIRSELADPVLVFEELGDEAGLARALGLAGQLRFWAGDSIAAIDDLERSAQHARNAGDRLQESVSLNYVLIASLHGPTPVAVALERAEQMRGRADGDRRLEVTSMRCRARLEAMLGNFEVGRRLAEEGLALAEELGLSVQAAGMQSELGDVELVAGRPAAAEALISAACETLERMGNRGHYVTVAVALGDALLAQDRLDDAAALIERIEDWAIDDDMDPQVGWRRLKGRLLARRGDFEEAERIAREAVELAGRADYIDIQARTHFDLAEVLRLAGRIQDSSLELEHALRLYEQKGNVVGAAKARALLDGG